MHIILLFHFQNNPAYRASRMINIFKMIRTMGKPELKIQHQNDAHDKNTRINPQIFVLFSGKKEYKDRQ
jgi:hypothetical protein